MKPAVTLRVVLGGAIGLSAMVTSMHAKAQADCLPPQVHALPGVATFPHRARLSFSLVQHVDGANAYSVQVRGGRSADLRIALRPSEKHSALLTPSAVEFLEGQAQSGDVHVTLLAVRSPDRRILPQAAIVWTRDSVSVAYLKPDNASDASRLYEMLALERVYSAIHQSDPTLRFHEELQAQIAKARQCTLARLPKVTALQPLVWEQARITALPPSPAHGKNVRVRVRTANGKPVVAASVAFARGEHLACQASTDSSGVAACELFDSHGHEDHEDAGAATVVTFGGSVSDTAIVLPRTATVK